MFPWELAEMKWHFYMVSVNNNNSYVDYVGRWMGVGSLSLTFLNIFVVLIRTFTVWGKYHFILLLTDSNLFGNSLWIGKAFDNVGKLVRFVISFIKESQQWAKTFGVNYLRSPSLCLPLLSHAGFALIYIIFLSAAESSI